MNVDVLAEVGGFRGKILIAQEAARIGVLKGRPTQIPPDFFRPQELVRFQTSDALITATVEKFMEEVGVNDHLLRRECRQKDYWYKPYRELEYILNFGGKEWEASGNDLRGGPIELSRRLHYYLGRSSDEGNSVIVDTLTLNNTPLMVIPGSGRTNRICYDAQEAVTYLRSPDSTLLTYAVVQTSVNEDGVRALLTVVASDPRLPFATGQLVS